MDEPAAIFARTAERYRRSGRFAHGYVRGKLRHDPVHADLLTLGAREPFGTVLDIGCGRGQMGIALLEAGLAASVVGIDWNWTHLRQAERAASGLKFRIEARDLSRHPDFDAVETVLLVDVLYQLATAPQLALLLGAARAAGSRILVRTPDPSHGVRGGFTRVIERLGRPFWPHSGAHVNALPLGAMTGALTGAGFRIAAAPCWGATPFANTLLVGRRESVNFR